MKINILTFHSAYNYGAFLQTYALQTILKRMNHDVEIIDYRPDYLLIPYYAFHTPKYNPNISQIKNILSILLSIVTQTINYTQAKKRIEYFRETISKTLSLSDSSFHNIDDFSEYVVKSDIYIAGSDQIWNYNITDKNLDPVYFFTFLPDNVRKCTYAASMGSYSLPNEYKNRFQQYVQSFESISLRECASCSFVKEMANSSISCVLDPTLLLNHKQWNLFGREPQKHPKKYILSYYFGYDSAYFKKVKEVANHLDLDIVWIHNSGRYMRYIVKHHYVRPEEFVWYFANASFVITDSFHGTMFSIINRKPFYSVAPHPQSVRIEDHLKRFGLLDRLYDSADKLPDTVTEIDYTRPYDRLEEWRQKSFAYLDQITKPAVEQ